MADFLLELRCEEIPARMQAGARADLEKLFRQELILRAFEIARAGITVWSTPRRLALIARGLPDMTDSATVEVKGPKADAPAQAIEGFLRKYGATRDQLVERSGVLFFEKVEPGLPMKQVLAEAIPAIVARFPWPKSMRWGAASLSTESLRWVRPLSGIVAIFGEELVECQVGDVASGYMTLGHRFHCPGPITIGGAADYQEKLRACHVIVDHAERQDLIREGAAKAAADAGLMLVADEGLVIENAGLTEWPVPLLGRFDEAFLDVPPEVIQLTARVNQKYFVCTSPLPLAGGAGGGSVNADSPTPNPSREREGDLANAFVCTANIEAADHGEAIVDGNRKVLAARLSDARFFWEQDRKTKLEDHAKKLERITFHEKLGTVADKVERVAKLARWLVEEGIIQPSPPSGGEGRGGAAVEGRGGPQADTERGIAPDSPLSQPSPPEGGEGYLLADLAEQAARLCKADLVTEMVGEFPELQGVMGGYYARAEGLPDAVADAIRDHYKPVGQGDEVPTAPVTVAVSLADKLDTLVSFFAVGERPTGSKDPFALRRASLSIINLIQRNGLRVSLHDVIAFIRTLLLTTAPTEWLYVSAEEFEENFDKVLEFRRSDFAQLANELLVLPGFDESKVDFESLVHLKEIKQFERRFYISSLIEVVLSCMNYLHDRVEELCKREGVSAGVVRALITKNLRKLHINFGGFFGNDKGAAPLVLREADLSTDDDIFRLLTRVRTLQNFIQTEDGANLLAAYKRAANILKKEDWKGAEGEIARTGEEDPLALVDDPDLKPVIEAKLAENKQKTLSYTPEPAEKELIEALDSAEPKAAAAVQAEDFEAAMAALASLRGPIDRFFDSVTVNDSDAAKRCARLDLLARFRAAVHQVADFSKIEG